MPSDSALRCRVRFTEPSDDEDEAVVDADRFLLCFDDRADCAEDAELLFEALEDARDRARSRTDVAGDDSAEK
jgi:hypothetical protein